VQKEKWQKGGRDIWFEYSKRIAKCKTWRNKKLHALEEYIYLIPLEGYFREGEIIVMSSSFQVGGSISSSSSRPRVFKTPPCLHIFQLIHGFISNDDVTVILLLGYIFLPVSPYVVVGGTAECFFSPASAGI
jgi:hypothetical protein